jgi:hypothetical protein
MKKFKDIINKQIDLWEKENNNSIRLDKNNKRVKYLLSFKNGSKEKIIIIQTIVKRIEKELSFKNN